MVAIRDHHPTSPAALGHGVHTVQVVGAVEVEVESGLSWLEVPSTRARLTSAAPDPIGARPVVTALCVVLVLTSVGMIVLVLLHKGKGGGLSTMFGGGVSSSLSGSAVVEKNLDRLTIVCGLVWAVCIIALGLLLKDTSAAAPLTSG